MTLSEFLSRLEGVKRAGSGWIAKCPAHEDRKPSLSIREGKSAEIIVKCHAGCSFENIRRAAGMVGEGRVKENDEPSIVSRYPYVDADGTLLFEAVRMTDKRFRQRRRDEQGHWIWSIEGVPRVPYRLPEVIESSKRGGRIWVVEGEKDVANMERAGLVATCCPMGAGKWRSEYNKHFANADVCIWADDDDPGDRHALDVGAALYGVAKTVRMMDALKQYSQNPGSGEDASDFFQRGVKTEEDWLSAGKLLNDIADNVEPR